MGTLDMVGHHRDADQRIPEDKRTERDYDRDHVEQLLVLHTHHIPLQIIIHQITDGPSLTTPG